MGAITFVPFILLMKTERLKRQKITVGHSSPEDLLARIVEVAWEREELVKKICQHFLDMPPEEGRRKLRKILGKKHLEQLGKLLLGGED